MTDQTIFECDVTGNRFGAKNDVFEYEIRRRSTPFEVWSETVHISDEAIDDSDVGYFVPRCYDVDYIGVVNEQVVGMKYSLGSAPTESESPQWLERDTVVIEQYEPFFEFLDTEVLYGG